MAVGARDHAAGRPVDPHADAAPHRQRQAVPESAGQLVVPRMLHVRRARDRACRWPAGRGCSCEPGKLRHRSGAGTGAAAPRHDCSASGSGGCSKRTVHALAVWRSLLRTVDRNRRRSRTRVPACAGPGVARIGSDAATTGLQQGPARHLAAAGRHLAQDAAAVDRVECAGQSHFDAPGWRWRPRRPKPDRPRPAPPAAAWPST